MLDVTVCAHVHASLSVCLRKCMRKCVRMHVCVYVCKRSMNVHVLATEVDPDVNSTEELLVNLRGPVDSDKHAGVQKVESIPNTQLNMRASMMPQRANLHSPY